MNVSTLVISADEARTKLDQHKRIQGRQRTLEDDKLQSHYASISRGARDQRRVGLHTSFSR